MAVDLGALGVDLAAPEMYFDEVELNNIQMKKKLKLLLKNF